MDHAAGIPRRDDAAPSEDARDPARVLRIGVSAGLVLSWVIMLFFAWSAFSTLPSPERLEQSRLTEIPTLITARNLLLRSGLELVVLLALLWPAARLYLARVTVAMLALAAWFLATVPLSVTTMAWMHRRWLAAVILALFALLIIGITARVVRRR